MTRDQLALIHVAKKQVGLDDAAYRDLLRQAAGVDSARHLDRRGFERLMRRFAELGFRSTLPRKPLGPRAGMATDRELALIRRLWRDYAREGEAPEIGLRTWLEKRFKVSDLRFLSAEDAPRVIGALPAMARWRKGKEQGGTAA